MRNKRIWLFLDYPNSADDNALYLFKYAHKQNDSIKNYFIINKNSSDYNTLKRTEKNIIPFGSLKHKLLYLYCEKLISSQVNHEWLNPFYYKNQKLFSGLIPVKKYFLQHGVTKDDISSLIMKYYHNLHLFLTVSEYEQNSIIHGKYNYDEKIVQCLGFPRYDYLRNESPQKIILIILTWRENLNDENFIHSDYYIRLKNFLNDEYLLNELKKRDFKIIFKPHYKLLKFVDMIEFNDSVDVRINDSYQQLFNKSSILITDFSSVAFDFAYLKKPIIYYQEEYDYHYDKGYFDYKKNGFGDIVDNKDSLVNKIIEIIDNGCKMENKYKYNVIKFFKYTDEKNCKRVYDWIKIN